MEYVSPCSSISAKNINKKKEIDDEYVTPSKVPLNLIRIKNICRLSNMPVSDKKSVNSEKK